jgi:hypothetical protein
VLGRESWTIKVRLVLFEFDVSVIHLLMLEFGRFIFTSAIYSYSLIDVSMIHIDCV